MLEEENLGLRDLVEEQTGQLDELTRRVAALEGTRQQADDTEAVVAGDDGYDHPRTAPPSVRHLRSILLRGVSADRQHPRIGPARPPQTGGLPPRAA